MSKTQIVTINGRNYDAYTGLPLDTQPMQAEEKQTTAATTIHTKQQRSTTLSRRFTKRPEVHSNKFVQPRSMDIRPAVAAKNLAPAQPKPVQTEPVTPVARSRVIADIGPVGHPHVAKAHAKSAAKEATYTPPTAKEIKRQAITEAIEKANKQPEPKVSFWKRHPKVSSIITASFALVILGGYFAYLNMPSLSVRVAAVQAGINAGYPGYRPDGYSLNGPVEFETGKVVLAFSENGGNHNFSIKQAKSGWDSSALLDNYITPKVGTEFVPYTERGLTIYSFENGAAWVNGGILYTIEGDAPLSNEQIRRIATSLI